jgi:hypothetical protein
MAEVMLDSVGPSEDSGILEHKNGAIVKGLQL